MRWITEDQQSLNDEIPKGWYKMVQVRENGTAYWYVYQYMYLKPCDLKEDCCQNLLVEETLDVSYFIGLRIFFILMILQERTFIGILPADCCLILFDIFLYTYILLKHFLNQIK